MTIDPTSFSRRTSLVLSAAALALGLASPLLVGACDAGSSGRPKERALILVDASDASRPAQAAFVADRKAAFEKERGRAVRVLHVESSADAIELASRGEADVALLQENAPKDALDRFFASDHGRVIGDVAIGDHRLKIISVNAKQHPKVDAQGEALAEFLRSPAPPR